MSSLDFYIRALLEGGVGAGVIVAIAFVLSRFIHDLYARAFLAILLIVAGGAYFGFAVMAQAGPLWILVELLHCVGFGALALHGLRDSPYWLAAGWGFHPFWDVLLHYFGPADFYAPLGYVIACASFDVIVAAYIAIFYGAGVQPLNEPK